MRHHSIAAFFTMLAGAALLCAAAPPQSADRTLTEITHAYHDHPSAEPLPATLAPSSFLENHSAAVAYSLASRIEQTLYQVPCRCGCDRERGHESLLDCFTGKHGIRCRICQKEAIFCYLEQNKGRSPAQIREALEKRKASKLDLEKYTRRFYSHLQRSPE
jgi:hypothetical protein